VVAFSIITTPETPNYLPVSNLEGLAPSTEQRFKAMQEFARSGILTGSVAMPLLPGLCDDDLNLQLLAKWTANFGGKFLLGGGLTLADQQKEFFMRVIRTNHPDLVPLYTRLYPANSYAQAQPWHRVGMRIHDYCQQMGISDRIPRPIIAGEKRELNKRIVEALAYKLHLLELENASSRQIWAYRKAAWAVEDLEQDIGLIYMTMGRKGLESIPNVCPPLSGEIESLVSPS
jgi:DNA repair photolyase